MPYIAVAAIISNPHVKMLNWNEKDLLRKSRTEPASPRTTPIICNFTIRVLKNKNPAIKFEFINNV